MKLFGLLNSLLVVILVVSISAIAFFSTIHRDFKDVPSMLNFLEKANVYTNVSTIIRLEIQNRYPPLFKNNAILTSIADKAIGAIVTPGLVEKAATPAIRASFAFAKAPTSIIDDKVVVATAKYKEQAKEAVGNLGLPRILVVNVNFIIDSVPANLTIVDTNKHPDSPLAWIIRIRTVLQYNKIAMNVSWIILFVSLIVLFVHNLSNIKRMFLAFWIAFIAGGLLVLAKTFLIPHIVQLFLPESADALITAQNMLVLDVVSFLARQVSVYGYIFVALGVVILIAWRFCDFSHFQKMLDRRLSKVHVPELQVKIK